MPVLPLTSHMPISDIPLVPGTLVMYENDGVPLLGVVIAPRKQKFVVLNQRGREAEMPANRLVRLPGALPAEASTTELKTKFLVETSDAAESEAAKLNLEELWTLLRDSEESFTSDKLAEEYYGKKSLLQQIAMRLALLRDRVFFKREDYAFSPRPEATVQQLQHSEAARGAKLKLQSATIDFFQQRVKEVKNSSPLSEPPSEMISMIQLLEDVAAGALHLEPKDHKEARELMSALQDKLHLELPEHKESCAWMLLEAIQWVNKNTDPALFRYRSISGQSNEFSTRLTLAPAPSTYDDLLDTEKTFRRNLSQVDCFTVDDASTRDMDDALSLEQTPDGYLLGVHITDVATLIEQNTPLDHEALRRATSTYCPEAVFNMLPPSISEDRLSLQANVGRRAISFLYRLDPSYRILGEEIIPSFIVTKNRFTYDHVDAVLDGLDDNHIFARLSTIASGFEEARIRRGAIKIDKKEVMVRIDAEGKVNLTEIDENSPARSMVAELMVLANASCATWAATNNIAMAFRGQEGAEMVEEPAAESKEDANTDQNKKNPVAGEGQEAEKVLRTRLKKSTVTVHPSPHASLGLSAYVQATSPIRRYLDLCHQRQLLSSAETGTPVYSKLDFEKIIERIEVPLAISLTLQKESKRFWLLRYLEQNFTKDSKLRAVVSRAAGRMPLVQLDQVYLIAPLRTEKKLEAGEEVSVRITSINSRYDQIKLEVA